MDIGIILRSDNNHNVENFGENTLEIIVKEDCVDFYVKVQGVEYPIDFCFNEKEFNDLFLLIKERLNQIDKKGAE